MSRLLTISTQVIMYDMDFSFIFFPYHFFKTKSLIGGSKAGSYNFYAKI